MHLKHAATKTWLKERDADIFASIGITTLDLPEFWEPELEVRIHHMAGMTISLDRNEALMLLAFLKQHEQALLRAKDPEAL